MAEITFVGAAGTVTGSKHLVSVGSHHFFVDCGLFQGASDVRALNDAPLPIAPSDVEAVVVTHGHIDHVGYLPKLVRDGFRGPIYCTPATGALMAIVLADAAALQHHLHERGLQHERLHAPPEYYDPADVEHTLALRHPVALQTPFDVCGVSATYSNAAHIIGSAFVTFQIGGKRVLFSGDVGRYGRPLLYDPAAITDADIMVCESTYGDRVHPPQPLEQLRAALVAGVERGGAIVIPAFAVERTQDILYAIGQIQRIEPAIAQTPVHLDSPMAERIDELFAKFPQAHRPLDGSTPRAPFGCQNFTLHQTTEESKQLNGLTGPHVIISASGMAAGGRVMHHLHNNIPDPKATIVFVGYQSIGTLGYVMVHGAHTVNIYGDPLPVRAAVVDLEGYSAHADKNDLRRWLATNAAKSTLYAVHGEAQSAAALTTMAEEAFGWNAAVARPGLTVPI